MKAVFTLGDHPFGGHTVYPRGWGANRQPIEERGDRALFSLGNHLYPPIRKVTYPAG
jgi:hypothetical protein